MQNAPAINPNMSVNSLQKFQSVNSGVENGAVNANGNPAQVYQTPMMAYPPNYYLPQQNGNSQNKTVMSPASSGVNIMIFNPSAAPPNGQVNNSCNYHMPTIAYPTPVPISQSQPLPVEEKKNEKPSKEEPQKTPVVEEKQTKQVTALTDELIQSIESYLRNPNPQIREQGALKVVELLAEDESRKNDVALTNLLNLMLQDNSQPIKLMALIAVKEGLVQGDELTEHLINELSNTPSEYGLYEELASNAALNRAGQKVNVQSA